MKLKHIDKLSTVAWSPTPEQGELLVAGTVSGSMDTDLDTSSTLELYSISNIEKGRDDPPILLGMTSAQDRFNKIAWSKPFTSPSENYSLGLVAGGHSNGSVSLWNPSVLLEQSSGKEGSAMVANEKNHSRSVHTLAFNPFQNSILATGSTSELMIWDLQKMRKPFPVAQKDNLSAIAWNRKVQRILAAGSSDGVVNVWDLKAQKPVKVLQTDTKHCCRAIEWHPEEAMMLVTASETDRYPVIHLWDLRNSSKPLQTTFQGHTKGIWSVSWCPHDPNWLLSSGKDSKIFCWNMSTNQIAQEIYSPYTYDICWSPCLKAVASASSLDRKVSLFGFHDVGEDAGVDEFEFGAPAMAAASTVEIPKNSTPPNWLVPRAGASFGFGGQLVSYSSSSVSISRVSGEEALVKRCEELEEAIEGGSLGGYCEKKASEATCESDKETWSFLATQFNQESALEALRSQLGLDSQMILDKVQARLKELPQLEAPDLPELSEEAPSAGEPVPPSPVPSPSPSPVPSSSPKAAALDFSGGSDDLFGDDDSACDPFMAASNDGFGKLLASDPSGNDPFTGMGSSTPPRGVEAEKEEEVAGKEEEAVEPQIVEDPRLYQFSCGEEGDDQLIMQAIMTGNLSSVIDLCQRTDKWADALLFAQLSPQNDLFEQVKKAYFENKRDRGVVRLVRAISAGEWGAVVGVSPLSGWRETLCVVLTYGGEGKRGLCGKLGDRLKNAGNKKAASFCYICAGDLNKTLHLWLSSSSPLSSPSSLISLMEKVIVLKESSKGEKGGLSNEVVGLFCRFASFLVEEGRFPLAAKFVAFLGGEGGVAGETLDRIWKNLKPEEIPCELGSSSTAALAAFPPTSATSSAAFDISESGLPAPPEGEGTSSLFGSGPSSPSSFFGASDGENINWGDDKKDDNWDLGGGSGDAVSDPSSPPTSAPAPTSQEQWQEQPQQQEQQPQPQEQPQPAWGTEGQQQPQPGWEQPPPQQQPPQQQPQPGWEQPPQQQQQPPPQNWGAENQPQQQWPPADNTPATPATNNQQAPPQQQWVLPDQQQQQQPPQWGAPTTQQTSAPPTNSQWGAPPTSTQPPTEAPPPSTQPPPQQSWGPTGETAPPPTNPTTNPTAPPQQWGAPAQDQWGAPPTQDNNNQQQPPPQQSFPPQTQNSGEWGQQPNTPTNTNTNTNANNNTWGTPQGGENDPWRQQQQQQQTPPQQQQFGAPFGQQQPPQQQPPQQQPPQQAPQPVEERTTAYDDLISQMEGVVGGVVDGARGGRHERSLGDVRERTGALYEQLRQGKIPEEIVGKLREFVARLEGRDGQGALRVLNEMSMHWGVISSNAMTGLQRLARAIS